LAVGASRRWRSSRWGSSATGTARGDRRRGGGGRVSALVAGAEPPGPPTRRQRYRGR
jgi:hypothetical protein